MPIRRGRSNCCARAASGDIAAAVPINVMKSRRRIAFPKLGICDAPECNYSKILRRGEWASGIILRENNSEPPMSALGQKRHFHGVGPMSAMQPKADIGWSASALQPNGLLRWRGAIVKLPRPSVVTVQKLKRQPLGSLATCHSRNKSGNLLLPAQ